MTALAARLLFRRRLPAWGVSALMVTALLTTTSWAIGPLTHSLDRWLMTSRWTMMHETTENVDPLTMTKYIDHRPIWVWHEGTWRLLDAFGAVVPALLAISAIRDLVRDRRGMTVTQWIGIALGIASFVVIGRILYPHIYNGGYAGPREIGPYVEFPVDDAWIPFPIILALFLLAPLTSFLVALLIHATLGPIWRRWIGSGYDGTSTA